MSGPQSFARYLTPEEAHALTPTTSVAKFRSDAGRKKPCDVCGQPAWRYGGVGMCFTCTTGESDASNDYELAAPSDQQGNGDHFAGVSKMIGAGDQQGGRT